MLDIETNFYYVTVGNRMERIVRIDSITKFDVLFLIWKIPEKPAVISDPIFYMSKHTTERAYDFELI